MKGKLKEYQVGELAKFYGVSPDTIRLYDKKGILPSHKNTENNYRLYDRENFIMMDYVMRLKKMEFSLEDICQIVNDIPIEQTTTLLQQKEDLLKQRIRDMELLVEMITDFKQTMEGITKNLGKVFVRESPTFICSEISSTAQETMDAFAKLELGVAPVLTIRVKNRSFFDEDYFDLLLDRESRANNAHMFMSVIDQKNVYQNDDFPKEGFTIIPAGRSLYFAVAIKTNVGYRESEPLREYINAQGIRVKGEPLIRLIATQNNKSDSTDFYEYWVPIEE